MIAYRCASVGAVIGALFATTIYPVASSAQAIDVEMRAVRIDHDPHPSTVEVGEQIPDGTGVAVRYIGRVGFVLEAEHSWGSQTRLGAICGGFIIDPATQCIRERVNYTGGLTALSVGWLGQLHRGRWSVGARPKLGLGAVRAAEAGEETQRSYDEAAPLVLFGVAAEAGLRVLPRVVVLATASASGIVPGTAECEDCRQIIRDPLPQTTVGVSLRWLH